MEKATSPRVFLFPDNATADHEEINAIKLKHPRTGSQMCCLLDPNGILYEIVNVSSKFCSWIMEDSVIEDGGLYIVTPLDPLFVLLPYFNKLNKFCPLEDILVDEESPDTRNLLKCFASNDLDQISESKDVADLVVYRYSDSKTLEWLRKKIAQIIQVLNESKVNINDGSKADELISHIESDLNDEVYLLNACKLVSEYLPVDLSAKLHDALGVPIEKEDIQSSGEITQQRKKVKTGDVNPLEDYSKNSSQELKKAAQKLTVSQKRLMKVNKSGMKNISSFFKKQ